MGNSPSHSQTPITLHSTHVHPLNLINLPQQTLNHPSSTTSCAGCKLRPSGMVYSCTPCNFFFHKKCFDMPNTITHPSHKEHALTLMPLPAYTQGVFCCDACGEAGSGFSYHCMPCGFDLHLLCAEMPSSVSHASHVHKLELAFEGPYGGKPYRCDICKNAGSSTNWLYRCNSCGFDAHLNCARGVPPLRPPPPPQPQSNINFHTFQARAPTPRAPTPLPSATCFGSTPRPGFETHFTPQATRPNPLMSNPGYGMAVTRPQAAMPQLVGSSRPYAMAHQVTQHMIQHNINAIAQGMLGGGVGGIGAAGYEGSNWEMEMQQLTQQFSNLNYGGGIGGLNGFGGSGGGQEVLQELMNGDGGGGIVGQHILQPLMDDGGGQDVLQELMYGDGGGGIGGQHILQPLMDGGGGQEILQALINGGDGGGLDFGQELMSGGGGLDDLVGGAFEGLFGDW